MHSLSRIYLHFHLMQWHSTIVQFMNLLLGNIQKITFFQIYFRSKLINKVQAMYFHSIFENRGLSTDLLLIASALVLLKGKWLNSAP
jgi:hypothetical protein